MRPRLRSRWRDPWRGLLVDRGLLVCGPWLSLAWLAASCQERPAAPLPAPTEASASRPATSAPLALPKPLGPAETREKLKALRDETVVEHGKLVTTASNVASYQSSLRRYEREALEVRLYARVPRRPAKKELRASLEAALAPLKLAPAALVITERATPRRALPATLPEGERFQPTPDDVRGVLDVSFELRGAGLGRVDEVLAKLAAMRRLFFTTRVVPSAGRLRVSGEAYWFFRDFKPPVMVPRPRVLDAALRERGIDPRKLAGDAEAEKWLDELTVDFRAMDEKKRDYARALGVQGALMRFDALMRFARDRALEASARTAKDVVTEPAAGPR